MGTLRIHFTAEDLARVTITSEPDPLWEVLFTRFRLRDRVLPLAFRAWRNELRADPARTTQMRRGARLLDALVPTGPYFPDFLTPHQAALGLDDGLEAVLGTPKRRLRNELRMLSAVHRLPGWVQSIAEGDVDALNGLGNAVRDYHQVAIAPFQSLVHSAVAADRASRTRSLLGGGVEGLFAGLSPLMRWTSPVLEMHYAVDKELVLGGRGLRLVPSYFCHRVPLTLADPDLPPVLIYPIDQRHRWHPAAAAQPGLNALMGRNRSAVLHALDSSATTTQLARMLRISPAAASRHTTVLREAGLIHTHREGTAVLHTLTPLGTALLEGRV